MGPHLTIQQFSRLSGIPAKLLRYYDSREILQPELRDERTGYRYYRGSQVARANRIKLLRDCGIGLEAIRELERLETARRTRKSREFIQEQELLLERRMESLLLAGQYLKSLGIDRGGTSAQVQLIQLPLTRVAVRQYAGERAEVVANMRAFEQELQQNGQQIVGDPVLIWNPDPRAPDSTQGSTIAIPVLGAKFDLQDISESAIPGGTFASIDSRGNRPQIGAAYERLFGWCYETGFVVRGPILESYSLEHPGDTVIAERRRPRQRLQSRQKQAGDVRILAPIELAPGRTTS